MTLRVARVLRKPFFWASLVLASFLLNIFLATVALQDHWGLTDVDVQQHGPSNYISSSLFGLRGHVKSVDPETHESFLWRRLLEEGEPGDGMNDRICGLTTSGYHAHNNNVTLDRRTGGISAMGQDLLPKSGFRMHVQQFVADLNMSIPTPYTSTSISGVSHQKSNDRSSEIQNAFTTYSSFSSCYLPPTTECDQSQYSVIIYSRKGSSNLRRLVLTVMAFQSYPSVGDIILLLHSRNFRYALESDAKYGTRLLDWENNGVIRILMVGQSKIATNQSKETHLRGKFTVSGRGTDARAFEAGRDVEVGLWNSLPLIKPTESAMLWINGDFPRKNWNGTSIRQNFQIWKRHSQSMVLPPADQATHSSNQLQQIIRCPIHRNSFWDNDKKRSSVDPLHGAIVHRNMLCFLKHPVFRSLAEYLWQEEQRPAYDDTLTTTDDAWETIMFSLSIVWNRLGRGHIMTLPPSTISVSDDTKDNVSDFKRLTLSQQIIMEYFDCICPIGATISLGKNTTCRAAK